MGFMVEHLLMVNTRPDVGQVRQQPEVGISWKKDTAAASAADKKKARARRDALVKKFKASKCP